MQDTGYINQVPPIQSSANGSRRWLGLDKTQLTWLVGALLIIAVFLFKPFATSSINSITVAGVGKTTVTANRAKVTFTFSTTNADRAQAIRNGEQQLATISNALSAFTFSSVKMTSAQTNQVANGSFQYANGGQVVLDDLTQLDSLINVLISNNATPAQIVYSVQDETIVTNQLRQLALADAQTKADEQARVVRGRRGRVINVTEQPLTLEVAALVGKTLTPSTIKEIELSVNTTTTFALNKPFIWF